MTTKSKAAPKIDRRHTAHGRLLCVSTYLPPLWVQAMDLFASRRSMPGKKWSRNDVFRHAMEIGLRKLLPTRDIAWPPLPKTMPRTVKRPRVDKKIRIAAHLADLFEKHPQLSLGELRRAFHHRDNAFVDAALVQMIQAGKVVLFQQRTPGRNRAVYQRVPASKK